MGDLSIWDYIRFKLYFTRNVGMKELRWKVEIERRKDRKNFGRRGEVEGLGEKIARPIVAIQTVHFTRNERVELEG